MFNILQNTLQFHTDYGSAGKVCGLGDLPCLHNISNSLRQLSQGNKAALRWLLEDGINCECPAGKTEMALNKARAL